MAKFTIQAMEYNSSHGRSLATARPYAIDSEKVLVVSPVGQNLRTSGFAPIGSSIAVAFVGEEGDNRLIYMMARLLEDNAYDLPKYDHSQSALFLRACKDRITDEELTLEVLRAGRLAPVKDTTSLSEQILSPTGLRPV